MTAPVPPKPTPSTAASNAQAAPTPKPAAAKPAQMQRPRPIPTGRRVDPPKPNPPKMLPDAMLVHYYETCKKAGMKPAQVYAVVDPTGKMLHWSTSQVDCTRHVVKLPTGHGATIKPWTEPT